MSSLTLLIVAIFLEIVKHTASYNEEVASVVLENAPKNATYASHWIQKEILSLYKSKIQKFIRAEIGDQKFCILVDESRDESKREQMAIILRFVDKDGFVRERFFDIVHVKDTKASTLKTKICEVLSNHELNVQYIRGQGYDGASNMRGEWNAAAERGWRVYLQDEHGTSSEAMDHMIAKGLSKSAREGKLDAYAAMKVLERYFSHSGTSIELVVPKQVELQNKLRILTSTQKNSKHCKENCPCIFCSKYAVLHCQGKLSGGRDNKFAVSRAVTLLISCMLRSAATVFRKIASSPAPPPPHGTFQWLPLAAASPCLWWFPLN